MLRQSRWKVIRVLRVGITTSGKIAITIWVIDIDITSIIKVSHLEM